MKQHILLFHFLLLSLFLSATEKSSYISLTTDQGLTSNTINCIYKDCKNFVWIGTANGLNRFDGTDILVFNDFKDKSIVDILEPDSSFLYILSEKELYKYDRRTRKNSLIAIDEDKITLFKTFALDKEKNLYVIDKSGLYYLEKNSNKAFKIKADSIITSVSLTDIYIDNENICWLSSSNGLIKYNLNTKQTDIYKNAIENKLLCLIKGTENRLYIGTHNSNIISFDTKSYNFSKVTSLESTYIQTMKYDKDKLYVGTNGNGLKIIDIKKGNVSTIMHTPFTSNNGLNTNAIYSILISGNTFWIGTFSGGINYRPSKQEKFKVFHDKKGMNTSTLNIRSFIVNNEGYGVYGTRNGLIYNPDGNPKYYTTENTPELKSNIILSIHPYKNDYLIGTYGGGLYLFDTKNKTIKRFKDDTVFNESSFYSIIQNEENIIWFGTLSGLIKYNIAEDSYTSFNTSNSDIVSNDIYSLIEDSSNRIWIATREGICYLEKDKINKITNPALPYSGIVRYIYEDSKQNIWLGCENQGAIAISGDISSFKHFTTLNILPDNYVSSIIEDDLGQVWLTTPKGVVLYKDYSEYSIFSLYDGIPSYTFNDGAVLKTDNNTIWWGNEKGLIYVYPSTIKRTTHEKIDITKVVIDGFTEEAKLNTLKIAPEYSNTIVLPSSDKNLVFKFSDFEYNYPASIVYEYKLEGLHDAWQKTLSGKDILIANIPSGKYVLKLREAGNNNSVKSIIVIKNKSYTIYWVSALLILTIIVLTVLYKRVIYKFKKNAKNKIEENKPDKLKYQNLKLEKGELEDIKQAIINYMETDTPYLNPNLKLDDMAKSINYPKIKISQVLNLHLDTNFSNLVSKYRIEIFKEKAKEGMLQQYTLSALAKECGFSSRSSFFHTVKKLTGQTPAEFLKEAGIIIDNEK